MNTNCLVTKLKGVVDNSDLEKYGEIVIDIIPSDDPAKRRLFFGDRPFTVEVEDGELMVNPNGDNYDAAVAAGKYYEFDGTGLYFIWLPNVSTKLHVRNKYQINRLSIIESMRPFDISKFYYCNLREIILGGAKGLNLKTSELARLNCDYYRFGESKGISGSIEEFKNIPTLNVIELYSNPGINGNLEELKDITSLRTIDLSYTNITGDITVALGKLTNLARLFVTNGTKMSGTVESLVQTWRSNGRTSGRITAYFFDEAGTCTVTFNGNRLNTVNPSSDPTKDFLAWTENTITCYGKTINA